MICDSFFLGCIALLPDPVGDSGHWLHPCDVVYQTILPASQAQEEGEGEGREGRGEEKRGRGEGE